MMEGLIEEGFSEEDAAPNINIKFPVGSLFDHESGFYVDGCHGEKILVGGTPNTTAIVGENNQFKSTVTDYMQSQGLDRYYGYANMMTYDSEGSKDKVSVSTRYTRCPNIMAHGIYDDKNIFITNHRVMNANEYWEKREAVGLAKLKNKKKYTIETPIMNGSLKSPDTIKTMAPTYEQIDSWSKLDFDAVDKKYDNKTVGSKDLNMYHVDKGRAKDIIMNMIPSKNGRQGFYSFLTAHVGKKMDLDGYGTPEKIMSFLQQGKYLKGVSEAFLFMTQNMWHCMKAKPCTDDSGIPLYGRGEPGLKSDKDLIELTITNLRGKAGSSGTPLTYLFSQREGHYPHLTQLNYIRNTNKYYGMDSGTTSNLVLDIYPDRKFTRNSVRPLIDEDYSLRRALEITSNMCQMKNNFWKLGEIVHMSPMEVFMKVKERGYDWDEILGGTHEYWTPIGMKMETNHLSTYDILRMAVGTYKPYWLHREL